jgi:hypothetical protein
MNLRKILLSVFSIGIVALVAVIASDAFFFDEETSVGNSFVAGAIDLKLDNESYVDQGEGLVLNAGTTWGNPNGVEGVAVGKFFDFTDLKPGDNGEDTISIHLSSNPAWMCVDLDITANADVDCTEPENEAEAQACLADAGVSLENGDLAKDLNFAFWWDDGDNVYEDDEVILTQGPATAVLGGVTWVLADSVTGDKLPMDPTSEGEPHYIGKAWCYGELTMTPVADGSGGPTGPNGPGYTCDGSLVGNEGQTDLLTGDITFRAVQARHNERFICARPGVEMRTISLENKDSNWSIVSDDQIKGDMDYSHNDTTFHGVVTGIGLESSKYYQITLNGPTEVSGTCGFTTTALGDFGSNTFQSGYWNSAFPNLSSTCTANDEEGLYNMNLIGDHYTFIAEGDGSFSYPFDLALPAGDYVGVKVLVKKMLDTHVSPWVDDAYVHINNLFEVAPISFTVLP